MLNPFTKYFLASDIKDLNKEGRRNETLCNAEILVLRNSAWKADVKYPHLKSPILRIGVIKQGFR